MIQHSTLPILNYPGVIVAVTHLQIDGIRIKKIKFQWLQNETERDFIRKKNWVSQP